MWKPALAGAVWLIAIWFAYEVVWSITGVPRFLGPAFAILAVLAFVVRPARLPAAAQ